MTSRFAKLFALLFALALVAAACGGSKSPETPKAGGTPTETETESEGGTITIGTDKANDHGEKTVTGGELSEELDDFYFEPTTIKGQAGSQVKLELENEGAALHNFTLGDQNIDQDVKSGQKVEVTVTMPSSGFLEFFCKYHKTQGMVGQLEAS